MNRRPRFTSACVMAIALGFASDALAQHTVLHIPGIPGESTLEGYPDWIDVLSVRQSSAASSRKSIACDVSVVKHLDIAGPAIWATAASGLSVSEMRIVVLRGADRLVRLYEIGLKNVRISGVQATSGASDSSETVTLVPQEVTLTYFPQLPNGNPGTPVSQTFSCQ